MGGGRVGVSREFPVIMWSHDQMQQSSYKCDHRQSMLAMSAKAGRKLTTLVAAKKFVLDF